MFSLAMRRLPLRMKTHSVTLSLPLYLCPSRYIHTSSTFTRLSPPLTRSLTPFRTSIPSILSLTSLRSFSLSASSRKEEEGPLEVLLNGSDESLKGDQKGKSKENEEEEEMEMEKEKGKGKETAKTAKVRVPKPVTIRVKHLTDLLNKYRDHYFRLSQSLVTDYEYDQLLKELEKIESTYPSARLPDSPTDVVGSPVSPDSDLDSELPASIRATGVAHKKRMLSLSNTYNREDIEAFFLRVTKLLSAEGVETKPQYCVELKLDGIAMSLQYVNGEFSKAVSRGDGVVGEDVTPAFSRFVQFPLKLLGPSPPAYVEIRGEVVIDKENFEKASLSDGAVYATRRNLASGVINRKKGFGSGPAKFELTFFPYGAEYDEDYDEVPTSHTEKMLQLEQFGFTPNEHSTLIESGEEEKIYSHLKSWEKKRQSLPYDIDGVVMKVNSVAHQHLLSSTAKSPRWATSYKFPPTQFRTQLLTIHRQVGRTGRITPVAELTPIEVDGVTISRATLHNRKFVEDHGITVGSTVLIERGGDVIPKVLGVAPAEEGKHFQDTANVEAHRSIDWDTCPCGDKTPLMVYEGKVDSYCVSYRCPSVIERKIIHFCSKQGADIGGFGPAIVKELLNFSLLRDIDDIFLLDQYREPLQDIPGWGEKRVTSLLANIEHCRRHASFTSVLCGLGVPHVGRETAAALTRQFPTYSQLLHSSVEDLSKVESIGEKTAIAIHEFFHPSSASPTPFVLANLVDHIDSLRSVVAPPAPSISASSAPITVSGGGGGGGGIGDSGDGAILSSPLNPTRLKTETLTPTGSFKNFSRTEWERLVISCSGKVAKDFRVKTTILVCGEEKGVSQKRKKAEKAGVTIWDEETFLKEIGVTVTPCEREEDDEGDVSASQSLGESESQMVKSRGRERSDGGDGPDLFANVP